MKSSDMLGYALRSIRASFAAAYLLALAIATACMYFAGAIWWNVRTEKAAPCELTVTAPSYLELNEQTVQDILDIPNVLDASGQIAASASAKSGSYTADLNLTGIDGEYLDVVYTQGELFPDSSAMPWLVLTEAAAKSFTDPDKSAQKKTDELPPIDWLNADFTLQVGDVTVAAKVSGVVEGDEAAAYMSQSALQTLLQRQGQSASYTSAVVRIRNIGAAEAVTEQVAAMGYSVENMDSARQTKWNNQLREAVYLLIVCAVVFVCTELIKKVDTLKNRDMEYAREQALYWMGMTAESIQTLWLVQRLFLNIVGATLGVALSSIIAAAIPPELRETTNFALSLPWTGATATFVMSVVITNSCCKPYMERRK